MRGRKSTLLSIFSCRGFRAREDLTNRVPAVPHASAPKEPTSQTWQLVHGTPPSWRTHVAQDAGSRRGGVRSRFLLQLSCREHTTHTTHAAQGLAFPLFARLRWGHETCTLSANRAEPPCPALRFSMARADIMACGRSPGVQGRDLFLSRSPINTDLMVPVTTRDFKMDFTALPSTALGTHHSPTVSTGWALAEGLISRSRKACTAQALGECGGFAAQPLSSPG